MQYQKCSLNVECKRKQPLYQNHYFTVVSKLHNIFTIFPLTFADLKNTCGIIDEVHT